MAIAILLVASCGKTVVEEVTAPGAVTGGRCQGSVNGVPAVVDADATEATATVNTERDCLWAAAASESWVAVSPTSGQGDGSVTVTVAGNTRPRSRSATLTINEAQFTLTQRAMPCRFAIRGASQSADFEGARYEIGVETHPECSWEASSGASWIAVSPSSGTGNGTITVGIDRNSGGTTRSGSIVIADTTIAIVQSAAPLKPEPPPAPLAPPALQPA
ncbi:MAG: BACON domain-containing protein, partial [Vicinamibacterales bacterium]